MSEQKTNTKAAKLRALELLAPIGGKKRVVWTMEIDGEQVELEDVPPEQIEGMKEPVTFFTEFDLSVPAEVRDSFHGKFLEMKESGDLGIGGDEIRTVSRIPAPTQALKALAAGGGITDGLWPERGANGKLQAVRVPKEPKEVVKLLSSRSTPAIYAIVHQAIEAYFGQWNIETGELDMPAAEPEVVEEAGKSPTSSGSS